MTPEERQAELKQKVRTIVSAGGTCGICGEALPGGGPAVEVTFVVDLIFATKDITKCLCVPCAGALQARLVACVAQAQGPGTRRRG